MCHSPCLLISGNYDHVQVNSVAQFQHLNILANKQFHPQKCTLACGHMLVQSISVTVRFGEDCVVHVPPACDVSFELKKSSLTRRQRVETHKRVIRPVSQCLLAVQCLHEISCLGCSSVLLSVDAMVSSARTS